VWLTRVYVLKLAGGKKIREKKGTEKRKAKEEVLLEV
jgi:hypothetical protein